MPDFSDLIGGTKIYTEDERKEILTDAFLSGIGNLSEELGLDEEDIRDFRLWYLDQTQMILKTMREKLSEQELDYFLQWTSTPLSTKVQALQVVLQKKLSPRIMMFLQTLEEKKIEARRERKKITDDMKDDWSVD